MCQQFNARGTRVAQCLKRRGNLLNIQTSTKYIQEKPTASEGHSSRPPVYIEQTGKTPQNLKSESLVQHCKRTPRLVLAQYSNLPHIAFCRHYLFLAMLHLVHVWLGAYMPRCGREVTKTSRERYYVDPRRTNGEHSLQAYIGCPNNYCSVKSAR